MKPSIGRQVHVRTAVAHNGTPIAAATITRVWGEGEPQPVTEPRPDGSAVNYGVDAIMVNVTVIPDCAAPYTQGSIPLFDSEASMLNSGTCGPAAFWPPRV